MASDPIPAEFRDPTPEVAEQLKKLGVTLPKVSAETASPADHSDFVDNRLTAVGFSVYLGGYHLYCTKLDLPVLLPDGHVDFSLQSARPVSDVIYPDWASANAAVLASEWRPPLATPYAYYRGAGSALIVPTIFAPATAPKTSETMAAARRLLGETVSHELEILALAIVGGMILRTVFAKIVRVGSSKENPTFSKPKPPKVRPVNGTVNVGGGLEPEAKSCSNLNPIKPGSGGPTSGIPNHIQAGFEDIGDIFEPGSVQRLISRRLRYVDVNWEQAAAGTARVMAKGGELELNVWCKPDQVEHVIKAFKDAGFRNVRNVGTSGTGTLITGTWPG